MFDDECSRGLVCLWFHYMKTKNIKMSESATQVTRTSFQPDSDVHITLEDQQKINHFARYNAKHDDVKAELKAKQNELKNLEDAAEELILLEDSTQIPFLHGEVFMYSDLEETNNALDEAKDKMHNEIKELKKLGVKLKTQMGDLKTQLYGKFGNHINLEGDEE